MKLTVRRKRILARICEEWRQNAVTSGPADLDALRPVIGAMYEHLNMPEPELIRYNSPDRFWRDAAYGYKECRWQTEEKYFFAIFRRCFFSKADAVLSKQLLFYLSPIPFNETRSLESIGHQLADATYDNNKNGYEDFSGCCFSQRLALYSFALRIRLKCDDAICLKILDWRIRIAKNAFFWVPQKNYVLFLDRPVTKWDDQNRLHCEDGPAVAFEDCRREFALHGVIVPRNVVLSPETQSITEIREEFNAEVRRIRIERYGWDKYLEKTRSKLLDFRKSEIEGATESLMRSPEGKILVCACPSTGRVYALQVPDEIKTCEQAQAWLSGGLSKRITAAT